MGTGFGRVSVMRRGSSVTVRNNHFQVAYDLLTGLWGYADSSGFELIRGVCARWRQTDGKERATSDPCHRSFEAVPAQSDDFGEGARVVFSHRTKATVTEMLLDVYSDAPFAVLTMRVRNEGEQNIGVDRLELIAIPEVDGKPVGGIYLGGDPTEYLVYLNGSGHLARGFQEVREGVVYPDALSEEYVSDGIVLHPRTQRAVTFGFLESRVWWSGARVGYSPSIEEERAQQGISAWRIYQTCDGATCAAHDALASERLYLNVGTPAADAQRHYATIVSGHAEPQHVEQPSVTNTLEVGDTGSPAAERIRNLLTWVQRHGETLTVGEGGLRHLRLRGAWYGGANRTLAEHFPEGVRALVDETHAQGLSFGADVLTFLVEGDVEPGLRPALLQLRNGQTATFSYGELVNAQAFDPTHPLTREFLRRRLHQAYVEWNFDTVYTSLFPFRDLAADDVSRFRWYTRGLTRMQLLRQASEVLQSVKNEVAPDGRLGLSDMPQGVILSGAHRSSAGLDFYYQGKAFLWEGMWGLRELLRAYAAKWYTQGYWWDMELGPLRFVRGRPRNEAQLLITLGMLSGGHLSFADDLTALDAEETELLSRCFPLMGMMARPVPIQEGGHTYAWAQSVQTRFGSWELLALLNLADTFEDVDIQFGDLGLNKAKSYLAYEFWDGRFFGSYQRTFSVAGLPPRSVKLFALREETEVPMLLATDFHVSQGQVELMTLGWDEKGQTLLGVCRDLKKGRGTLLFHVPDTHVPIAVACAGSKYSYAWKPPVYELHLAFGDEPAPFSIRFAHTSG
jgi:hypothetical protein